MQGWSKGKKRGKMFLKQRENIGKGVLKRFDGRKVFTQ
jgi:hypothetical protein